MTAQVIATPSQVRAERIRKLRHLIDRAQVELVTELRAQRRSQTVRGDIPPSPARGRIVRQWALREGLLTTVTVGRVSNELRVLYMAAGEPDGR